MFDGLVAKKGHRDFCIGDQGHCAGKAICITQLTVDNRLLALGQVGPQPEGFGTTADKRLMKRAKNIGRVVLNMVSAYGFGVQMHWA